MLSYTDELFMFIKSIIYFTLLWYFNKPNVQLFLDSQHEHLHAAQRLSDQVLLEHGRKLKVSGEQVCSHSVLWIFKHSIIHFYNLTY